MAKRQIAIGDIHGCNHTFKALLDQLSLTTNDELTLLGDFVDRGADSKGVIDTIFRLRTEGYNVRTLSGNHEILMLDALNPLAKEAEYNHWVSKCGGDKTLKSFGENYEQYQPFFKTLMPYFEDENFIFVHAGLNFRHKDPLSSSDIFWIRNWYQNINSEWLGKRLIVHGHTPISWDEISRQFMTLKAAPHKTFPTLNLDGGCVYSSFEQIRYLVAADLTNWKIYAQKNIEITEY
jgi:serine/threonine protein phosphatase 1